MGKQLKPPPNLSRSPSLFFLSLSLYLSLSLHLSIPPSPSLSLCLSVNLHSSLSFCLNWKLVFKQVFLFYFPPEMSLMERTTGGSIRNSSLKSFVRACACVCALVWIFSLFNIQCEWRTTSCPVIFRPFSVSAQYIFTNKNTKRWCIFVKPLSSILHCFPPGRLKADFFNKFWSQTYKQNRMSCSKTISEWSSLKKSFPSLPPSSWGQRHMTWAVVSPWATWLRVS